MDCMPFRSLAISGSLMFFIAAWTPVFPGFSKGSSFAREAQHDPTGFSSQPQRPEATWALEFKVRPHTSWPIGQELMWLAAGQEHPVSLQVIQEGAAQLLQLSLQTTSHSEPLTLAVPLSLLSADRQHVFLVRYLGFRVDLLCDGALVDQEWPIGEVPAASGATALTFHEPIQQGRFLSRTPSDEEIEAEFGGATAVAKRTIDMLGPDTREAQYMKPRGWNTNAGDAMPFYHDGTLHLFYLIDRRHHHSKWGLGAHQWAHIASTDLIHWRSYPIALPISHQWEGSICTGSVFYDKGTYYAFFATRMPDRKEHLGVALSADGLHFDKVEPSPFAGPKSPFREGPNRDPNVIRDGDGYLMTVTAALQAKKDGKEQGALEQLSSTDLMHWSALDKPFLVPGYSAQPECSDLFLWRGRYYLLFGINGVTHYRIGASLHGPWITPEVDVLDGVEARVMKTAEFHDNRRILVGWIGYDNFGGNLIFRELVQNADGTLGTKFPQEMYSEEQVSGVFAVNGSARDGTKLQTVSRGDVHLVLQAGPQQSSQEYGLTFRGADDRVERLIVDPASGTVRWIDAEGRVKNELSGVSSLHRRARIELARKGDLVDISVNQGRTMIHRLAVADASMSVSQR